MASHISGTMLQMEAASLVLGSCLLPNVYLRAISRMCRIDLSEFANAVDNLVIVLVFE